MSEEDNSPRKVWIVEDRGDEAFVNFKLYFEGVVGDPMQYRVPREFLKSLVVDEIPELAEKHGWEAWLG